tara:strand:+ start:8700 stop:8975 length:276 start_codon:yes stop_codon:yes gene_type:complete
MEINNFLTELSSQNIKERDYVTVVFNDNEEISGTLVPFIEIVSFQGGIRSRIIHPREDGAFISVKARPDGYGPDVGMPIVIESINSITKGV